MAIKEQLWLECKMNKKGQINHLETYFAFSDFSHKNKIYYSNRFLYLLFSLNNL